MSPDYDSAPAAELLDFIDRSPSPWHAVAQIAARLSAASFEALDESAPWSLQPSRAYYVLRGGSSLIAFRIGSAPERHGVRIIGAHTDSPGFRVKPSGTQARFGMRALGVEIYGGPIIATFADRDLTLAGRVVIEAGRRDFEEHLFHHSKPIVRLPNLAIHMNRGVNEEGLKFDAHEQLPLLFRDSAEPLSDDGFKEWLATELGVATNKIRAWDLAVADTQPGQFFGPDQQFIANSQLDNLASCHAALEALCAQGTARGVAMIACFDHEEVGSESFKGAAGSFLPDVLKRIAAATDGEGTLSRLMAQSWLLSTDMAHAWHPNFAGFYDEENAPRVNGGPAIKINAKQRYTTDAEGEAYFAGICDRAGVPCQRYVHRATLPCGSTIGPMTAAALGLRSVDVGNPMWSMHSIRESAGAIDHGLIIHALNEFLSEV